MLPDLGDLPADIIKTLFGDAASKEFLRTCAIFGFAAYVHARQVRNEIKDQLGQIVDVLKADLEGQKFLLGNLDKRVDKIEQAIKIRS